MIYRVLVVLAALILLAGTLLLGRGGDRGVPAASESGSGDGGYSARGAEIVQTGADGKTLYRLEAEHIEQRARDEQVELERLTMHYRTEQGAEWRLRAEHGRLSADANRVELDGAVRLTGPVGLPQHRSDAELELATEKLSIDARAQRVTTAEPVVLSWSGQRLAARGLAANLKDQKVQLESNVHGHFSRR